MLSDGKRTYTWAHGRELATVTQNGTTWTNTYDANGLRTKRTNGTTTYRYRYTDGLLATMNINDDVEMWFMYDGNGPMVLKYGNAETHQEYHYELNLQGDVIAIISSSGERVVEYTYDAWGNVLSITGSAANTIGVNNPLRYRGYLYDQDTQLYYLQSRYYDPELGRFINADAFVSTGQGLLGNNMFAYCGNNPVILIDPSGYRFGPTSSQIKATYFLSPGQRGTALQQLQREAGNVDGSPVVLDLSLSIQVPMTQFYGKMGISTILDLHEMEVSIYPHGGGGFGYSNGLSFSIGFVGNYSIPDDYDEHFYDVNIGLFIGIDHCWDPTTSHNSATQATAVTFSNGAFWGAGYDYYWGPF